MKLPKGKIYRSNNDGTLKEIDISLGTLEFLIRSRISQLVKFVELTQKGERQKQIQLKRIAIYRLNKSNISEEERTLYNSLISKKIEYSVYLEAVEYCILELNRLIETYHHEFVERIDDTFLMDLDQSPNIKVVIKIFKSQEIELTTIKRYAEIKELRELSNDLKHAYIKNYSLGKKLNLKDWRKYDRKLLVDKVNIYFKAVPEYLLCLAEQINKRINSPNIN